MGYNGVKESFTKFAVNQALKYLEKNPEENLPKLMAMVDKVTPRDWYVSQRNAVRKTLEEKGNWYDFILRLWDLDPEVRKTVFKNLILNASLTGSAMRATTPRRPVGPSWGAVGLKPAAHPTGARGSMPKATTPEAGKSAVEFSL